MSENPDEILVCLHMIIDFKGRNLDNIGTDSASARLSQKHVIETLAHVC